MKVWELLLLMGLISLVVCVWSYNTGYTDGRTAIVKEYSR